MSAAPDDKELPAREAERPDFEPDSDPAPPESAPDDTDQHSMLRVFLWLAARWPH
jgi:hypothetical protein